MNINILTEEKHFFLIFNHFNHGHTTFTFDPFFSTVTMVNVLNESLYV